MADPIEIESPQALINRTRFIGKDFFTFVDDLVSRIQLLFVTEFNDFVTSGTGQMLIDIVCWAAETLSFYIDRQATESYLSTARTRKAVNRLARQIGYIPSPAVAASVDLSVNLDAVYAFDVPIPVGFQFKGPNDLIFESVEEVVFPAGEGPTSVPRTVSVREGTTRTESFVSNGTKNQIFRLTPGEDLYVAGAGTTVTVDGSLWTKSDVITFDQTDQYELQENDVPPLLRFGNGVAGNIPANGAEISISYIATAGRGGLAASTGTINDVVSPLVVAFTSIGLVITNDLKPSGGDDPESLEKIKANAPGFFKARQVAVTREDYEGLSQAFVDPLSGAVAVAQAFVARGASEDLQLQILLDNIRAIMNPVETNVKTGTTAISGDAASLTTERDNAETANNEIGTQIGNAATASSEARVDAQSIKNRATQIAVDGADIQSLVTSGSSAVDAIAVGVSDELTAGTKATLKDYYDRASAEATNVVSEANSVSAEINNVVTDLTTIDDSTTEALAQQALSATALTNQTALISSIESQVIVIDDAVGTSFTTSIETELDAIYDHVDSFLSSDCKSNLVQVPIMARDVDGFLAAPSEALIQSLQSYLVARKEVTQVVEVVDGSQYLVLANISATIGVLEGFVKQTVLSSAQAVIDDLLKEREFGASLRVSDMSTGLVPDKQTGQGGIEGIDYVVLKITGPSEYLDADGNLIIDNRQVISKGTVSLIGATVSVTT